MQTKVAESNTTKKKKHGGRVKGTPNKSTGFIQERCEALGLEPIDAIIYFAKGDYESLKLPQYFEKQGFQGITTMELSISVDHRIDCLKTLVQYIYPKRKAIEHSIESAENNKIILAYSEESLKKAAQTDDKD